MTDPDRAPEPNLRDERAAASKLETALLERILKVLPSVAQLHIRLVEGEAPRLVFQTLLEICLDVTQSQFGFFGEAFLQPDGRVILHSSALSDLSWDAPTREAFLARATRPLVFDNMNSLFGVTLRTGRPYVSNDPEHDPEAAGLPAGHVRLTSYMGLPVSLGGELVGMLGLGNRPGGYSYGMEESLEPVLLTAAQLIHAVRADDKRRRAEAHALERRRGIALVTELGSRFLRAPHAQLSAEIDAALATIGQFVGADRAYLFSIDVDRSELTNTHEWCADGIEPQRQHLQGLPIAAFSWVMPRLLAGEIVHLPSVQALPEWAVTEGETFEAQGIKSLILLPVEVAGRVKAFIGFDAVRGYREWDEDSVSLLRAGGYAIAHALERDAVVRLAERQDQHARQLTNVMREGVFVRRATTPDLLFINDAVERIYGMTRDELFDGEEKWLQSVHPSDQKEALQALKDAPSLPTESNYRVIRPDGTVRHVHTRTLPVFDERGEPDRIIGLIDDVTDQVKREKDLREARDDLERRVQERTLEMRLANEVLVSEVQERQRVAKALERSEQRFRTLAESIPSGLLVIHKGVVQYANAAFEGLTGVPQETSFGKEATTVVPEFDLERTRREGQSAELTIHRTDGEVRQCEITVTAIPVDGENADLVTVVDVTQRRAQERLLRLQLEDLAAAARALTLSELSASLAHELNQPLAAIALYTHGCVMRLEGELPVSQSALLDAVRAIAREAARAGNIVQRLRALFERRSDMRALVELPRLLRKVVELMSGEFELKAIQVQVHEAEHLPMVSADAQQLELLFINLFRNAIDSVTAAPPPRFVSVTLRSEGSHVIASVRDSGAPVPEEVQPRLFDPFFTTRASGIGLGLAIARSVSEAHGGALSYQNHPETGKAFVLQLPAVGAT